jgi:hypothetical protein
MSTWITVVKKSRALLKSCFAWVTANCMSRKFTMAASVGNHETSDISTALDSFMCTVLLYNDEFASVHQYAPAKPNVPVTLAGRTNGKSTQDAKSLTGSYPAPMCLGLLIEVSRLHSVTRTLSRTSLNEWSARLRDLYLTTHNTHNRQTDIDAPGRVPTHNPSKRASMGISLLNICQSKKRCLLNM